MKGIIGFRLNNYFSIFIVFLICVIVNVISYDLFARLDLTENKLFTISPVSKKILSSLDDYVHIRVFYSSELPPAEVQLKKQVEDFLTELKIFSGNKLMIEFLDPLSSEDIQREVRTLGIRELIIGIVSNNKRESVRAFKGIAVTYKDRQAVIPIIKGMSDFEYELISSIKKVIEKDSLKIGMVSGHGEVSLGECELLTKNLLKQYEINEVLLSDSEEIKKQDILIIAGPKKLFTIKEKFVIDQFIMRGKSIVFLHEPFYADERLRARAVDSNVNDLLKFYGVFVGESFIADKRCDAGNFTLDGYRFTVPYHYFVDIQNDSINQDHIIVQGIKRVVVQFTAPLVMEDSLSTEREVTTILKSSEKSYTVSLPINMHPRQKWEFESRNLKSYPLFALLQGKFSSYFSHSEIPEEILQGENENSKKQLKIIENCESGRMVIGGSTSYILDKYAKSDPTALYMFMNTIDYIAKDPELISIRSRNVNTRKIREVKDSHKELIKIANIFGMALLTVFFGVFVFFWRKFRLLRGEK